MSYSLDYSIYGFNNIVFESNKAMNIVFYVQKLQKLEIKYKQIIELAKFLIIFRDFKNSHHS